MEIIVKVLVVIDSIKIKFSNHKQKTILLNTIKINGPKDNTNGINVAIPSVIKLIIKRFQLEPKRLY
jgi:hypothetical protein